MPVPATPLVLTATPTLFAADESLDLTEIRRHYEWLDAKGVDALFPAGTSGEFPTLSDDERIAILDIALEVFGADRVFIHVGAPSGNRAENIVRRAIAHGARKLAAITPFFQPAPEAEVLAYFERLVQAADGAQLFAYLFEARTTTHSRPELLPLLAEIGVAGVKISGESDERVDAFLAAAPEGFTVFSGNDIAFGHLVQQGGHGIVSGVSSAFPEPFVALREALVADDTAAYEAWLPQVVAAVESVRAGSLSHLKAGITARGFRGGTVRSAVAGVPDADLGPIRAIAEQYAG